MASIIDPTLAKKLIALYVAQNTAAGGPALMVPEELFLKGFFIDRKSLETILKDPEVSGISIELAKHPDHQDAKSNMFTIIFHGSRPNPDYPAVAGSTPLLSSNDMYDHVLICPPYCPPPPGQ